MNMTGNFGARSLMALSLSAMLWNYSAYSQSTAAPTNSAPGSTTPAPPTNPAPSTPAAPQTKAAPSAPQSAASHAQHSTPPASTASKRHKVSPYKSVARSDHAANTYETTWGVNTLLARSVPADQLIRFSYQVADAAKAKALNAKESAPQLIDEARHVSLVVPTMDKIGQLRQSSPPENGKTYWMVFSNKGNVVKRGDRVSIVIGQFRADGLAVE
jgi:hypothetical protein